MKRILFTSGSIRTVFIANMILIEESIWAVFSGGSLPLPQQDPPSPPPFSRPQEGTPTPPP